MKNRLIIASIIFVFSAILIMPARAQFKIIPSFSPTPTETQAPTFTPTSSQLPTTDSCIGLPWGPPDLITGQQNYMGADVCEDNNPCTIDSCVVGQHNGISYYQGDDEIGYPTGQDQYCIDQYPACEQYFYPKCSHIFSCPSPGYYCPRSDIFSGGHYLGFVPAGVCGIPSPTASPLSSATGSPTSTPTPSPTPFEPCIPTFCEADEPVCGTQTYGKDSCGNDCQKDGGVCVASPTPSASDCLGGPGSCPSPTTSPVVSETPFITTSTSPTSSFLPTFSPLSGNNPPTLFGITVDQPNYCQVGLNISVNVRWSYADVEGNGQQTYQVQIDTDPNFGSPDLDTGEVLSATHASGFIGAGQLKYAKRYYARVRVRDSVGQLSAWY